MRIAFVTSVVYPSPTANRIHILAMVTSFAKKAFQVDLLCQSVSKKVFPPSVTIVPIGTKRSVTSAWKYVTFLRSNNHDAWFVREPHLLLLTMIFFVLRSFRKPPFIFYEIHDLPRDFFDAVSLKFLSYLKHYKIITITSLLKDDLIKNYHLRPEKIVVLADGVDLESFTLNLGSDVSELPQRGPGPLVVYTGSLFPWKGVYTLLEAAKNAPDITFWVVGGYDKDIEIFKSAASGVPNMKVWGYVPHDKVRDFLAVADVLVLPNSATYVMSEKYTSPLKLFEYMASKKPIVASRLPSLEEVLIDGVNAYLVAPDNASSLEAGIRRALSEGTVSNVVTQARVDVEKYTWDKRVEKILEGI